MDVNDANLQEVNVGTNTNIQITPGMSSNIPFNFMENVSIGTSPITSSNPPLSLMEMVFIRD